MTFVCHPCCILVNIHPSLNAGTSVYGHYYLQALLLCVYVCLCMCLCLSPEKNNYKLWGLSLWGCLSILPPWLHGCNRLITCLVLIMSPCWQLFPGLWTQTHLSWAWFLHWVFVLQSEASLLEIWVLSFRWKLVRKGGYNHWAFPVTLSMESASVSWCLVFLIFSLFVLCMWLFNFLVEK